MVWMAWLRRGYITAEHIAEWHHDGVLATLCPRKQKKLSLSDGSIELYECTQYKLCSKCCKDSIHI